MKKIYVSHPFGGSTKNKGKADKVLGWLRRNVGVFKITMPLGDDVHNVFLSPIHLFGHLYSKVDYETGMSWCLELLKGCDAIIMCARWENSTGCNIERNYAIEHGIQVIYINELYAAKATVSAANSGISTLSAIAFGINLRKILDAKDKETLRSERTQPVN